MTASTERLMKGYKDIVLAKTETKIVIVIENVADFMTESRLSMMQRKVMGGLFKSLMNEIITLLFQK